MVWHRARLKHVVRTNYCYFFSFGNFFSGEGLRAWLGGDRGSSARASPVLSGGSAPSVARVLVQKALPRESCSTLPLGPFCCRLKSGRRIFTVSTMPNAPVLKGIRYSSLKHRFWIVLQLGHRMRIGPRRTADHTAEIQRGKRLIRRGRIVEFSAAWVSVRLHLPSGCQYCPVWQQSGGMRLTPR